MRTLQATELGRIAGGTTYNLLGADYLIDINGVPPTCIAQIISMLNDTRYIIDTQGKDKPTVVNLLIGYAIIQKATGCNAYADAITEGLRNTPAL